MPGISFTPGTRWKISVCDADGVKIASLTHLALEKQLTLRLNRPAIFTFRVPSEHPQVNLLHTDGRPYLAPWRVIKAYRWEAGTWVLRFTGHVWEVDDEDEDGNRVTTTVRAMDAFQWLSHRYVRSAAGVRGVRVSFASTAGAAIAQALVDRTIAHSGPVGIQTTGTFDTTTDQTVDYEFPFAISDALVALADTRTLDLIFDPVDRTDGILSTMSAVALRGTEKPHVKLAYDRAPRSITGWHRNQSMDDYANDVLVFSGATTVGKKALSSATVDTPAQDVYGVHEFSDVFTDITQQPFLDSLSTAELNVRNIPIELVTVQPVPEKSASFFTDYDLGDFVFPSASDTTREDVSGLQRVYGATLDIDDSGFERVAELVVSKESE